MSRDDMAIRLIMELTDCFASLAITSKVTCPPSLRLREGGNNFCNYPLTISGARGQNG